MPRSPQVNRTLTLHGYGIKYIRDGDTGEILSGTFYLPKEYKTSFIITVNLERIYGIHVLSIDSHHVVKATLTMPLDEFIKNGTVTNYEPIMDEYYNDKFIKQKG